MKELIQGDRITWRDADGKLGTGIMTMPLTGLGYYVVGQNGNPADLIAVHKNLVI